MRAFCDTNFNCIRPLLHLNLKANVSIKRVKDKERKRVYHTLEFGEYPKTKVSEEQALILEDLYNKGNLKNDLIATGRWTTSNNGKLTEKFAGKHDPQFEYKGKIYTRVFPDVNPDSIDGRWLNVEPISWEIINWDEMPKNINPKGNGTAKYFELKSEYAIQSNIPFYALDDENSTMWQNSTIRGFLNGIDVRDIKENGNINYTAANGGNFTGECNFLNEAFNGAREPITEYTIPDSEEEIPENSFNGCVTLKKLIIHPNVQSIGKDAFAGCNFKYAYKLKSGELVLDENLPQKEESEQVIDLKKITKAVSNFYNVSPYEILLLNDNLTNLEKLLDKLIKTNFVLSYDFIEQIQKKLELEDFVEKTDFRFFKNEMNETNKLLSFVTKEERIDFLKFATCLRLF